MHTHTDHRAAGKPLHHSMHLRGARHPRGDGRVGLPGAPAVHRHLRREDARLVTTSYVLVEAYALIQRRVGPGAVHALRRGFAPLLEVVWVDASTHESALDELDRLGDAAVSLVDAASFVVMWERSIHRAFAFDTHFKEGGFERVV